MPRTKTTTTIEPTDEVVFAVETPKESKTRAVKAVPVKVVNRPVRRVSFEQWATLRRIKQSHKGGMKAFLPNPNVPRSFEAWDKVFQDY